MSTYLEMINTAEEKFLEGSKAEALELYIKICEEADAEFLDSHTYAYKRSIQILNETGDNPELAVKYMGIFEEYFKPDENGEIYIELADKAFLDEYRNRTYEKLAEYYYAGKLYGSDEVEFVIYTFEETVSPEFAYTAGLYLEDYVRDNVDLMNEYGGIIVDAYTAYLSTIDPFEPDIDKIRHAHGILDYYYGFGYGVERNLELSMMHENANKQIKKKQGRDKSKEMADLLAGISNFKF